jgi:4-amino-4-deoxychorismate lyase
MYRLIESIRIIDGVPLNIRYHNQRFNESRQRLFKTSKTLQLENSIRIPETFNKGEVKCRIIYGKTIEQVEFEYYKFHAVHSLKLVFVQNFKYEFKFEDRTSIELLKSNRGTEDDVLIINNGFLTDTSICNIVLWNGREYHTPSLPLLKGTMRAKYLENKLITEKDLKIDDLRNYITIHLINAFLEPGRCTVPVGQVVE